MTNKILIKRTATPAKVPATTDLSLGELSINTNDGTLFLKKNAGSDIIVPVVTHLADATHTIDSTGGLASAASGVTAGTYSSVTVDNKGRVTAGSSPGAGSGTIKQITSAVIAAASGTSIIPYDNTTPLNTEGTQIWTKNFTPTSVSSSVLVQCSLMASVSSANRYVIASLFRGSTCIGVAEFRLGSANYPGPLTFLVVDAPATTSQVTYSCRVGVNNASTWYINQEASAVFNGMLATNGYLILEW